MATHDELKAQVATLSPAQKQAALNCAIAKGLAYEKAGGSTSADSAALGDQFVSECLAQLGVVPGGSSSGSSNTAIFLILGGVAVAGGLGFWYWKTH